MSLYLCVDCGGSKTSVVICDNNGNIIGRAIGGPSNFAYLSLDAFVAAVALTITTALEKTPPSSDRTVILPPTNATPFAAAWFGVSGVDSPTAIAAVTPALSKLLGIPEGPRLAIANDTHLLAAPVRMYPDVSHAVAVIGGTGSIAVTFSENAGKLQELGRAGGWGWILGDEGGGFHVGREAIRQILMEHDKASIGSPLAHSTLRDQILDLFKITDVMEILTIIHLPDPPINPKPNSNLTSPLIMPREKRLSSLSPLVFSAAFTEGDALALQVLRTCAGHLAEQISLLLGESSEETPRAVRAQDSVISFGGSLVGIAEYRNLVLEDLRKRGHIFRYVEVVDDAAATGAKGLVAGFVTPRVIASTDTDRQ